MHPAVYQNSVPNLLQGFIYKTYIYFSLLTLILSQFCSCTFAPVCSQASVLMIIHPALGVMQRMRDALDSSSLSCVSQQRFGVCFAWWAGWRSKGVCSFAALLMSSSQDTVWFVLHPYQSAVFQAGQEMYLPELD